MRKTAALRVLEQCVEARKALHKEAAPLRSAAELAMSKLLPASKGGLKSGYDAAMARLSGEPIGAEKILAAPVISPAPAATATAAPVLKGPGLLDRLRSGMATRPKALLAAGLAGGYGASYVPVKDPTSWLKNKVHEWTKPAPAAAGQPAGTDWAGMAKQYGPMAAGGGVIAALAYLAMNRD